MPLLDELLVGLGFEYDPKESKKFNDDIKKSVDLVKGLTRAAVAGAAAITGLVVASTLASDEQGKLAAEIGDTVENIDALQFALKRSGGTADGMTNSLRSLAVRASEAARGVGSGVEAFGLLGIEVLDANGNLKTTTDLMSEVAKQFETLGKSKQIELADKLGIRDSIRLLQQGRGSIAALTAEARALGVTTAEDALIAADFQDSLTDVWQITKDVTRTIAKALAPGMKELNNNFTEWWKTNKDLIKLKLPEWIDKITSGIKLLTIAVGGFLAFRLVGHLVALITLFKGLTVVTLAATAAAFLLPALLAAAAVAFVALIEDAKTFFEGGESFIGDMLEKFPEWNKELKIVAGTFGLLADFTQVIFDGWSKIFDLDIGEFFSNLPDFVTGVFGGQTEADILAAQVLAPTLIPSKGSSAGIRVDKIEISVPGAGDPQAVANAVFNIFQQTAENLEGTVEQ